jgi:hypothetical protein
VRGSSLGWSMNGLAQVGERCFSGAFENVLKSMLIQWLVMVSRWSWSVMWLMRSKMSSSFFGLKRGGRVGLNSGITVSGGGGKTGWFSCTFPMTSFLTSSISSSTLLMLSWIETLGALWRNSSDNSSSIMSVAPSMESWALVLFVLMLGNCKSYVTMKRRDSDGTWIGSSEISSST